MASPDKKFRSPTAARSPPTANSAKVRFNTKDDIADYLERDTSPDLTWDQYDEICSIYRQPNKVSQLRDSVSKDRAIDDIMEWKKLSKAGSRWEDSPMSEKTAKRLIKTAKAVNDYYENDYSGPGPEITVEELRKRNNKPEPAEEVESDVEAESEDEDEPEVVDEELKYEDDSAALAEQYKYAEQQGNRLHSDEMSFSNPKYQQIYKDYIKLDYADYLKFRTKMLPIEFPMCSEAYWQNPGGHNGGLHYHQTYERAQRKAIHRVMYNNFIKTFKGKNPPTFDDYLNGNSPYWQGRKAQIKQGISNAQVQMTQIKALIKDYGLPADFAEIVRKIGIMEGKNDSDIENTKNKALLNLDDDGLLADLNSKRASKVAAKLDSEGKWQEKNAANYDELSKEELLAELLKTKYAEYKIQTKFNLEVKMHETNSIGNEALVDTYAGQVIAHMEKLEAFIVQIQEKNRELERRMNLNRKYRQHILNYGWVMHPAIVNPDSLKYKLLYAKAIKDTKKTTLGDIKLAIDTAHGHAVKQVQAYLDAHRKLHNYAVTADVWYEVMRAKHKKVDEMKMADEQEAFLTRISGFISKGLSEIVNESHIRPIDAQQYIEAADFDSRDAGNLPEQYPECQ